MAPNVFTKPRAWIGSSYDPADAFVSPALTPGRSARLRGGAEPRIGLFGIPFDGAAVSRKGAAGGPAAIRGALASAKPWTVRGGPLTRSFVDLGDVRIPKPRGQLAPGSRPFDAAVQAAHAKVEAAARDVRRRGFVPLVMGGDHSITYPLLCSTIPENAPRRAGRAPGSGAPPKIGVVNVDAHLDIRDPAHGLTSGTPFSRALALPILHPSNYAVLGARDFATSPSYGEKARRLGVTVTSAAEVARDPELAARKAVAVASRGTSAVYLSIDLDVVDIAHAPGVSAPGIGGISGLDLLRVVASASAEIGRRSRLVGADVVEVAPRHDSDARTSRLAAACLLEVLANAAPTTPAAKRGAPA